tara:strand:+ start:81867 stop:82367 length:501 start_codon:yes stop_codon:yes gene_type:complete
MSALTATHCSDCAQPLKPNKRRKGTRCKPCNARALATSDTHREAVSCAMSRRWANPSEAFRLGKAISAGIGPEEREPRRARGKIGCNARAAAAGSEARAKAGRSLSRTRLGWLPVEYRGDYFHLRRNFKYRAPDARRIIEAQMARDLARYVATGALQQAGKERGRP